uniref:Uncharacterized protein n=1 Tax=Helianthus annuus TaxID=4232 RepID=A0A251TWZ2_HELAN
MHFLPHISIIFFKFKPSIYFFLSLFIHGVYNKNFGRHISRLLVLILVEYVSMLCCTKQLDLDLVLIHFY